MKDIQDMLKEHGMKTTSQRLFVLKSLQERGHATIDEIHEDLKVTNPAMSLTTIYRNINEMMKSALVSEVKLPKQKQRYEIVKEPHLHLACEKCGMVQDAMIETGNLIKNVEDKYACDVIDDAIVLNVVCKKCREKSQ